MEHLSTDEQIDLNEQHAESSFAKRMFNASLAALRAQNPFICMLPFPNKVVSVVLTANTPKELFLPEGTKLIRFRGNSDYFVSINGNAAIPTASDDAGNFASGQAANASMYKPEGEYYYVEEIKSLSLISATAGTIVTVHCYSQL